MQISTERIITNKNMLAALEIRETFNVFDAEVFPGKNESTSFEFSEKFWFQCGVMVFEIVNSCD